MLSFVELSPTFGEKSSPPVWNGPIFKLEQHAEGWPSRGTAQIRLRSQRYLWLAGRLSASNSTCAVPWSAEKVSQPFATPFLSLALKEQARWAFSTSDMPCVPNHSSCPPALLTHWHREWTPSFHPMSSVQLFTKFFLDTWIAWFLICINSLSGWRKIVCVTLFFLGFNNMLERKSKFRELPVLSTAATTTSHTVATHESHFCRIRLNSSILRKSQMSTTLNHTESPCSLQS